MIKRSNELIYVKRRYLFPFKPMLDWEYKKFGYKKCDVGKTPDSRFFNTVYYVRHKEMPQPALYMLFYGLTFLFSFLRCVVLPILVIAFIATFLIYGMIYADITMFLFGFTAYALLFTVLSIPLSVIFTNLGHNIYVREDVLGKTNRALNNNGWDNWSSYKDNDVRFTPPGVDRNNNVNNQQQNRNTAPVANNNFTASKQRNNMRVNNATDEDDDDDEIITLENANGELIDFEPIAMIANKGKLYALLVPVEKLDGMDDDECLVFECTQNDENGNPIYNIELDDNIIDEVMASYDKLYDEAHG